MRALTAFDKPLKLFEIFSYILSKSCGSLKPGLKLFIKSDIFQFFYASKIYGESESSSPIINQA